MGNLEKPLTWVLIVSSLVYLFISNFDFGKETSCSANNGFNFESANEMIDVNEEIKVEIQIEDKNLNIDSMVNAVLENIDMEDDIDTVIETDVKEETSEQ